MVKRRASKLTVILDHAKARKRQSQYTYTSCPPSPPYSPVGHTFLPIKLQQRFSQLPFAGPFSANTRVRWNEHPQHPPESPPCSPKSQPRWPFPRSQTIAGERPNRRIYHRGPAQQHPSQLFQQQRIMGAPSCLPNFHVSQRPTRPTPPSATGCPGRDRKMQRNQPEAKQRNWPEARHRDQNQARRPPWRPA